MVAAQPSNNQSSHVEPETSTSLSSIRGPFWAPCGSSHTAILPLACRGGVRSHTCRGGCRSSRSLCFAKEIPTSFRSLAIVGCCTQDRNASGCISAQGESSIRCSTTPACPRCCSAVVCGLRNEHARPRSRCSVLHYSFHKSARIAAPCGDVAFSTRQGAACG